MRLIAILFLAFFIASCSAGSTGPIDYRTGSQALELRITDGGGQEVFVGDELSLFLEVRNRGTHDITSGLLAVKGYDPVFFPSLHIEPSPLIAIKGKTEYDPYGELVEIYEITEPSVRAPPYKEVLPQTLQVVACYDYVSRASYDVCIDPDPYDRKIDHKVCTYSEVESGAQGHPVAVTSIEEKISKYDVRFNLRIANVGDGIVYDRHVSPEACIYDLDRRDLNVVDIVQVSYSGHTLRCDPQNPIRLNQGGTALVSCVCENCLNPDQGAYKTVLNVIMAYGYRNDVQTQVQIVKN